MSNRDVFYIKCVYTFGKFLGITPFYTKFSNLNKLYSGIAFLIHTVKFIYVLSVVNLTKIHDIMKMIIYLFLINQYLFMLVTIGGYFKMKEWKTLLKYLHKLESMNCGNYNSPICIKFLLCLSCLVLLLLGFMKYNEFSRLGSANIEIFRVFQIITVIFYIYFSILILSISHTIKKRLNYINLKFQKIADVKFEIPKINDQLEYFGKLFTICRNIIQQLNNIFGWSLLTYIHVAILKILEIYTEFNSGLLNWNDSRIYFSLSLCLFLMVSK